MQKVNDWLERQNKVFWLFKVYMAYWKIFWKIPMETSDIVAAHIIFLRKMYIIIDDNLLNSLL